MGAHDGHATRQKPIKVKRIMAIAYFGHEIASRRDPVTSDLLITIVAIAAVN